MIFGDRDRTFPEAACAFFQASAEAAERDAFPLAPGDFAAVNPNTGTAPVFRTRRDAATTRDIHARLPVLVDRTGPTPVRVWPVRYMRMFDMTNDSRLFRTAAELRALGAYKVQGGRWVKAREAWLPLFEGKMVQAYDHRAASVVVNVVNVHRPAQPRPASDVEHSNPSWLVDSQFHVAVSDIPKDARVEWLISYKMITAPTNMRTLIATILPPSGFGNSMGVLLLNASGAITHPANILGNLNSFVLDYVLRQKIQGQNINWYMVEQLPFNPGDRFEARFGSSTATYIIREDVLHLTYPSHDMAPFARDLAHNGPPFAWHPEERLRRRARLDAVFFHLYGLGRDDADYVMGTFAIVAEQERRAYGRFRSRDLVLAYMNALAAGDPDAPVVG